MIMNNANKTNITPTYPISLICSPKNSCAIKTVNSISPIVSTEASDAVVCSRPVKYRTGAITAPNSAIINT